MCNLFFLIAKTICVQSGPISFFARHSSVSNPNNNENIDLSRLSTHFANISSSQTTINCVSNNKNNGLSLWGPCTPKLQLQLTNLLFYL